jgi:hypothetical protein
MNKEEKYIVVNKLIKKRIGNYLHSKNYVYKGNKIVKDINDSDSLYVSFTNPLIQRSVVFDYFYLNFRHEIAEYFVVFIEKEPYAHSDDVHSIENIFKHEKKEHDASKFFLLNYEGTFERQVEQFCDYIIDLFGKYLREWLSGEKWLDIPFDWGNYK